MSFERPWLLLSLLLVVGAVGLWLLAERRRARYAVRYTNLEVLASVAGGRSWARLVPPTLFGLALVALLVALARPQVHRTLTDERATVILVIDTSRSMQATDVQPTRLGAAQEAVRTFLDRVPSRLRVGLVVFAGDAQVATPPTRDHALVRQAVDDIGTYLVFGGTAIGDALRAAVDLGKQAVNQQPVQGQTAAPATSPDTRTLAASDPTKPRNLVSILFLSDGEQTRGALQPLEGAQLAKDAGFPVYTIALGTPTGTVPAPPGFFNSGPSGGGGRILVPPDPVTLRQIAETTGGKFSEARSAKAVDAAYSRLGSSLGRKPGKSEVTFAFVAAAALLLLAAGIASALTSPRLP